MNILLCAKIYIYIEISAYMIIGSCLPRICVLLKDWNVDFSEFVLPEEAHDNRGILLT